MTGDNNEKYDTFNTKGCPDELILGNFNDQSIPYDYYNLLNYDDDNGNNIPGTLVENALPYNRVVEDAVISNDEEINDEIIIEDDDILASYIETPHNNNIYIEVVDNKNECREVEGVDVENEEMCKKYLPPEWK